MTKWNAKKVKLDGYTFDSKAEARRYDELKILKMAFEITELVVHPKFVLQGSFQYKGKTERAITYTADFAYMENGDYVVEDVKGFDKKRQKFIMTNHFRDKRKMFLKKHPKVDFRIVEA